MLIELSIVVVLTLINGLMAMSELAIVSARPARLKLLADRGSRGARTALKLAEDPGRFLSSVQIGITLVGVLSGAFSGATLGVRLTGALIDAGLPQAWAQPLGVGGVVVAITYLSLIAGELVPKQIALRAPEAVAVKVAPMMRTIALVAAPLVWLLDRSGKLVLALLGQSGDTDRNMTDEEVKLVISEAQTAGVMDEAESQMIAGVMRIADRTARGLMTPRQEVEVIDLTDSAAGILRQIKASRRSRLPVRDGDADTIIGIIATRDVLDLGPRPGLTEIRSLIQSAPVVNDGMAALDVIADLRTSPTHMLLVYDEYGNFKGIITPMDVLEAITGDFIDTDDNEPKVVTRQDGSYLVSGWMPVDEFADLIAASLPEDRDYETVAGLILDLLGSFPAVADSLMFNGWKIEVVDLDGHRIDKLLVSRPPVEPWAP